MKRLQYREVQCCQHRKGGPHATPASFTCPHDDKITRPARTIVLVPCTTDPTQPPVDPPPEAPRAAPLVDDYLAGLVGPPPPPQKTKMHLRKPPRDSIRTRISQVRHVYANQKEAVSGPPSSPKELGVKISIFRLPGQQYRPIDFRS